jgi:hypothetical protein
VLVYSISHCLLVHLLFACRFVKAASSIPFEQQLQEDDPQSIPGEWDEFDKIHPMNKGIQVKSAIDNPTDNEEKSNQEGEITKKEVANQIQESNTQTSFKVTLSGISCS